MRSEVNLSQRKPLMREMYLLYLEDRNLLITLTDRTIQAKLLLLREAVYLLALYLIGNRLFS